VAETLDELRAQEEKALGQSGIALDSYRESIERRVRAEVAAEAEA